MKSIFILAAAIAVFGLTFYMQEKTVAPLLQNSGLSQLFNEWKELHGRQYDTLEEELYRLSLFTERHFFIQNYNSKTVKLGHNQFSDLSNHEFRALHVNKKLSIAPKKEEAHVLPIVNVPQGFSWVGNDWLSPVLNQAQCGSCWAFSAAENLGFIWAQGQPTASVNPQFSEQELVSCSQSYKNDGCDGGWYYYAWEYTHAHGITTSTAYPYASTTGVAPGCPGNIYDNSVYPRYHPNSGVINQKSVPASNAAQFKAALAKQVISVAIQADQSFFQSYESGVIGAECGTQIDHAVLAVGFTETYAILQNSWGTTWGSQGLFNVAFDANQGAGACGVLLYPAYAVYSPKKDH